jgi:hypothetical protein
MMHKVRLSRVEIVLKAPAEYQVESNGNAISLNIGQMDAVSAVGTFSSSCTCGRSFFW